MAPLVAVAGRSQADPVKVSGFPPEETPVSIGGCFGMFLRRVVPSHMAYAAARAACDPVIAALRSELYRADEQAADHLIAGSVGKRTALAPVSAVDILYFLPAKLKPSSPGDSLKMLCAVLNSGVTGVRISGDAVTASYGDMNIRVMPGRSHGGAFLVPGRTEGKSTAGWLITNPVAEAATLRLSDSLYGGRPRLLLTALKAWRAHIGAAISAFALEQLVQEFYASAPRPYEMERALADFWAWGRKRTPGTINPPGGQHALHIGGEWHGKAKAAYWRATLADHHLKTGKLIEAAVEWRQVLGPAFPVPGEQPLKALPLFKKAVPSKGP